MSGRARQSEAVSLYVHVPFCASKCRYCAFYSEPVAGRSTGELVSAMIAHLRRYDAGLGIRTVYIGGGTPTCLGGGELVRLVDAVHEHFGLSRDGAEFTVEANPGQVSAGLLAELRGRGVNRLSIGAQSFDDAELAMLGRGHSAADIAAAVKDARGAGFANISLDLIFALPGSTAGVWERSLGAAVELGAEHISAYSLAFEPCTQFHRALEAGEIVATDEETDRAMYERTIEVLGTARYGQYEISNFARPGFECAHNLGYWANDAYVGIGPAAASYFGGVRWTNAADIAGYSAAVRAGGEVPVSEEHRPTDVEVACETAVLNLRRTAGIDLAEYEQRTGYDLLRLFGREVEANIAAGLLRLEGGRLALTREALPVADAVLADFAGV